MKAVHLAKIQENPKNKNPKKSTKSMFLSKIFKKIEEILICSNNLSLKEPEWNFDTNFTLNSYEVCFLHNWFVSYTKFQEVWSFLDFYNSLSPIKQKYQNLQINLTQLIFNKIEDLQHNLHQKRQRYYNFQVYLTLLSSAQSNCNLNQISKRLKIA